jgi:hypothetical protein
MVFDIPTSVTAAIFIGVAVPIALIVPIVTQLAMLVVTAVAAVRTEHTRRQSKSTCDHDVASHTIEGIHRLSPTRSAKRMNTAEPRIAGFALKGRTTSRQRPYTRTVP